MLKSENGNEKKNGIWQSVIFKKLINLQNQFSSISFVNAIFMDNFIFLFRISIRTYNALFYQITSHGRE